MISKVNENQVKHIYCISQALRHEHFVLFFFLFGTWFYYIPPQTYGDSLCLLNAGITSMADPEHFFLIVFITVILCV